MSTPDIQDHRLMQKKNQVAHFALFLRDRSAFLNARQQKLLTGQVWSSLSEDNPGDTFFFYRGLAFICNRL